MIKLLVLLALVGCSIEFRHKGIDGAQAEVGPNFEKAATFCDERYGQGTLAAEECFKDYRDYTKIQVEFNIDSFREFCSEAYTDPEQQTSCVEDLVNLFDEILQ